MLIKEILVPGLKTISPEASMAEAERRMKSEGIRHLPVLDGKRIVGILSNRDIQRAQTLIVTEHKSETVIQGFKKVADYMSSPVQVMQTTDSVEYCAKEMVRLKISSMVIEENHQAVGIITTDDLLVLLVDKLSTRSAGNVLKKLGKGLFKSN